METDSQKERRPLEAAYVENPACLGGHTQSSNEARIEQDSPRLAPIPAVAIESRSLRFHEEPVSTVSARDLHKALGVRRVFANWIRPQLARALLVAGHDYTEIVGAYVDANKNASGRPRRDFYLTIDAAKHVAMLAGTSRGRELREFFIEAERQLRTRRMEPAKHAVPETLGEALRLAADLADRNNALTATIHTTRPKALAFERLTDARGSMCISDAAKALHLPPRMLFKWLEARRAPRSTGLSHASRRSPCWR